MTRTFNRVCQCCGTAFTAGHPAAKWCHLNCRVQAHYCRKRGEPIRPAFADRYAVDPHLPVQWQEQSATGHEARVWAGTAITRRQADGYVNATAMCKAGGKRWPHYFWNASTTAYIAALTPVVGIPATGTNGLVQSSWGGTPDLQGTWIHPRLAVDLARWISPAFAVWMDGWFLESLSRPHRAPQPLPLTPGIHIVANSPRHARWIWAQAVEGEVSASLMRSIAEHRDAPFQTHLLPPPSTD
jgi:hypothetical protein